MKDTSYGWVGRLNTVKMPRAQKDICIFNVSLWNYRVVFCRNRRKNPKTTQNHKGPRKYKVLERKMKLQLSCFLTLKYHTTMTKAPSWPSCHKNMQDLGQQNRKLRKNPAKSSLYRFHMMRKGPSLQQCWGNWLLQDETGPSFHSLPQQAKMD